MTAMDKRAAKERVAHECRGCAEMRRRPSKQRNPKSDAEVGATVHIDFKTVEVGVFGMKYFLAVIDDHSRWGQGYPLRKIICILWMHLNTTNLGVA